MSVHFIEPCPEDVELWVTQPQEQFLGRFQNRDLAFAEAARRGLENYQLRVPGHILLKVETHDAPWAKL